jgi:hypothetical protein
VDTYPPCPRGRALFGPPRTGVRSGNDPFFGRRIDQPAGSAFGHPGGAAPQAIRDHRQGGSARCARPCRGGQSRLWQADRRRHPLCRRENDRRVPGADDLCNRGGDRPGPGADRRGHLRPLHRLWLFDPGRTSRSRAVGGALRALQRKAGQVEAGALRAVSRVSCRRIPTARSHPGPPVGDRSGG